MEENNKEELLEEAKELLKSDDVINAYYKIKQLGRNFKTFDDASLYDQELSDSYYAILDEITAKIDTIQNEIKAKKEDIIVSAKKLLDNNDFKSNKMKNLMDDWKNLNGVHLDKEIDDELWNKFNEIKNSYYDNKKVYYDELLKKFEDNKQHKLDIIEKAKDALELEDIASANKTMNDLMNEWKKVGSAGKENEEEIWKEFSSLRKEFFTKRDSYYEQMKSVYNERALKKRELIASAKINLAKSEFTDEEVKNMEEIKAEWKAIGFAGKDSENELWQEFSRIVKKYNDNMKYYR